MLWEAPTFQDLTYDYVVPTFEEIKAWVDKGPTKLPTSTASIRPGYCAYGSARILLCVGIEELAKDRREIQWVQWTRDLTGVWDIQQLQQACKITDDIFIDCAVFSLDKVPRDGQCPSCHVALKWVNMAERCPKCWWVKL